MMALIRNGGQYTVSIGVTRSEMHPGDSFYDHMNNPPGPPVYKDPDIGSGLEEIPEGDCRYIQADRVGDGAYAVAVAREGGDANRGRIITCAKIGPREFWEFNGENFNPGGSGDCKNNHGW
jgi:hypothetical protein